VKKNKEEKKLPIVAKRPNWFAYRIVIPLGSIVARILFKFKSVKTPEAKAFLKSKKPFLVVSPHMSKLDVGFVLLGLKPARINVVTGRDLFSWGVLKPFREMFSAIPMSQFALDLASIRILNQAVKDGLSIYLCPEGKITLDGTQMHYLPPATAKLVKMIGLPVLLAVNNGAYSALPKWGGIKHGKVTQQVSVMITEEEIKTLKPTEIYERLKAGFVTDQNEYQIQNQVVFKNKKPAKGLHHVLFKCPKCGEEYENYSTETELICASCGNAVKYLKTGELVAKGDSISPGTISKWYAFERASIKAELLADPEFVESHPVIWEINKTGEYVETGEGELIITRDALTFKGKDYYGVNAEIVVPIAKTHTIVEKMKEGIDITLEGDVVNRFYFRDQKFAVRYLLIVEEAFKLLQNI
jgi:1-acyl-sn-glycerol-3-phosphate acyltransferase